MFVPIHRHSHSSRSVGSFFTALFAGACGGTSWIWVLTSHGGPFGILMAGIACAVFCYTVYFWVRPVVWWVELTRERLRWHSPHMPCQSREIAVGEIESAAATGEESGTVELRLVSGETVRLPPACVGRNPRILVDALNGIRRPEQGGIS